MAYNTILLSVNSASPLIEGPCTDEEIASEIVWPGSLCSIKRGNVLGVATDHSVHTCGQSVGGGQVSPLIIALEDLENGRTVNDRYYPGEIVKVRHLRPGDIFQARFEDLTAHDMGTRLSPSGGTGLGQFTTTTFWDNAMAYAQEAIPAGTANRLIVAAAK